MPLALIIAEKNVSSWSMRPWLALKEKGVPFEERVISLLEPVEVRREKLRAVSQNGKVPALDDDGFVLCESLAIMEYIEERFPTPPLLPRDLRRRAEARMLMSMMHAGYAAMRRAMAFDVAFHPAPPPPDKEALADVAEVLALWEAQRRRHQAHGDYLVGELSLADLIFVPVIHRLRGFGIDTSRYPLATRWMDVTWARPSVRAWMDVAQALPPAPPH